MDRKRAGVTVLILFAATSAVFTSSPLDSFNSENPNLNSPEDFELEVDKVQEISESESVAYGKGYRINATLSLSQDTENGFLVKYRTKRGTSAGGPETLYNYRFMDSSDKIDVTIEQNHEKNHSQTVVMTYIPVKQGLEEKDLENITTYRVFMSPEKYPEYVRRNKKKAEFKFNPAK